MSYKDALLYFSKQKNLVLTNQEAVKVMTDLLSGEDRLTLRVSVNYLPGKTLIEIL